MIQQIQKKIIENGWFCIFLVGMAVYYGYRLFGLDPWYDELYTYFSFISRGPIYAAIHWPLPNNHVFYSVVSGIFDFLGNSYIGLRGASYLASLTNLCLLYTLCKKHLGTIYATACSMIFASVYLVNFLAVQGRGYALATSFYLLALLMLQRICLSDSVSKATYIGFSVALTLGLYTLPSSTFWVIPVCLIGGGFLLLNQEYRTLIKLIISALVAAFNTLFLYAMIWLAIGANLISKDANQEFYGVYQVNIILAVPFRALKTGMDYMLASPFIQSISRKQAFQEFFSWTSGMFNLYFQNGAIPLFVLTIGGILVLTARLFRRKKEYDKKKEWLTVYLLITLVMFPVMLLVQSVQPYNRVFSFWGAPLGILFVYLVQRMLQKKWTVRGAYLLMAVSALLCVFCLSSNAYNTAYAGREMEIKDAFSNMEPNEITSIFYLDDYQKYVLKFYWDLEPQEKPLEEASVILIDKQIEQEQQEVLNWPLLYNHSEINWTYIEEHFSQKYENDMYVLMIKNE